MENGALRINGTEEVPRRCRSAIRVKVFPVLEFIPCTQVTTPSWMAARLVLGESGAGECQTALNKCRQTILKFIKA